MPITVDADVVLNYLDPAQIDHSGQGRVISLHTLVNCWTEIKHSLEQGQTITVERTDESATTLWHIIKNIDFWPWIQQRRLKFITGGDADPSVANLNSEHFLAATIGSQLDLDAAMHYENPSSRPYTFLFTNRKMRPHRKYLVARLYELGTLKNALWSCHESHYTWTHPEFNRVYDEYDTVPVKTLDAGYDPEPAPDWIDGVIYPRQYQDTWFSVVTETAHEYPYSFRTEKIYKPIIAGHPFMVSANYGFYRDLHNLGFKTFGDLIDESFDQMQDGQQRLEALAWEIDWLCTQDLSHFWEETATIRLYNQQRAMELHNSQQQCFTKKFMDFLNA